MTIAAFASAPYVANIRLVLPPSLLKASPDAIRRWAARAPSDTRLLFQTYRWVPWPHHQGVWLSDLRRLPASKSSLANLEYVPMGTKNALEKARAARGGALAMRMYGQLQVNRNVSVDKSQLPGVWDALWERIPIKGEARMNMASLPAAEKPRKAQRVAWPKRQPPPPPPPGPATYTQLHNARPHASHTKIRTIDLPITNSIPPEDQLAPLATPKAYRHAVSQPTPSVPHPTR
ncbi:hypothetical protein LTR95_003241 [Oleoguttula sp. CCFEE 5521]